MVGMTDNKAFLKKKMEGTNQYDYVQLILFNQ